MPNNESSLVGRERGVWDGWMDGWKTAKKDEGRSRLFGDGDRMIWVVAAGCVVIKSKGSAGSKVKFFQ